MAAIVSAGIGPNVVRLAASWDRLLRAAERAQNATPWELPASPLGTGILSQVTTADASLTKSTDPWPNLSKFRWIGGTPVQVNGSASKVALRTMSLLTAGSNIDGSAATELAVAVEFVTEAPKLTLVFERGASTGYRVAVDGQYLSKPFLAWDTADAFFSRPTLTFASAASREIRVEFEGGANMVRVYTSPLYGLRPSRDSGPAMAVLGDSLVNAATGSGCTFRHNGYAALLGMLLGRRDVWTLGFGGSGHQNQGPNGVNQALSAAGTLDTLLPANSRVFDEIWVQLSPNDDTSGVSFPAALATTLQGVRARQPNAHIVVPGYLPNSATGATNTVKIAAEATAANVISGLGDRNLTLVQMAGAPGGPAIFGTGRVGATTGDGNADVAVSTADRVHWSDAGHEIIARAAASEYLRVVRAKRAALPI